MVDTKLMTPKEARTLQNKARRVGKNFNRRTRLPAGDGAGYDFIKTQAGLRWPDENTRARAQSFALGKEKEPTGKKKKRATRPMPSGFPLIENLMGTCPGALHKLLVASSLQIKKVRRYPGYVLSRTYNLKDRPIEII